MSDDLIDGFFDTAAISGETKFIADQLKVIIELLDKVSNTKVSISGASSMGDIVNGAKEAKSALDQLTTAKDTLTKSELMLAKVAKENANAAAAQAKANKEAAKTTQERAKADVLEAKALKDLAAAEKLEAGAKKELALQSKALAQARKENAIAANVEQKTVNASAREQEKKQLNELGYAYREYSKAARDASLRAKSYALTLGEADPRTQAAVKNAKEMNETLARVDASVGQFGRNVGNYKSGFDGLANSFTQISRELPSLAVSFQTFALAVSNNLPMVVDEVQKAGKEVKELRMQGEQTPGVFKRVLSSALSLNVGISIAIALFTVFASKISDAVAGLFDSESATKKAAKAQLEYNERLEETIELRERQERGAKVFEDSVNRALENDLLKARARGASEKEILEIEKELLKQRRDIAAIPFFGEEENLDELNKKLRVTGAEIEELLKKNGVHPNSAAVMFGLGDFFDNPNFSEEDKAQAEQLKKQFEIQEKAVNRRKAVEKEFYDANRDLDIKNLEILKANADDWVKFFADDLQKQADLLKAFSETETDIPLRQVQARKKAFEIEAQILQGQRRDELRGAKDNANRITEINREYAFKQSELEAKKEEDIFLIKARANVKKLELDAEYNEQYNQFTEEQADKAISAIQDEQARRQAARAAGQQIEIAALNKSYNAAVGATKAGSLIRERIEKTYAEKRAEIEFSYTEAELKNQIEAAEKLIKVNKDKGENVADQETELAKLKIQLSDLTTQHIIDNSKKEGRSRIEALEDAERGINTLKGVYTETTNLIDGLLGASIDKQKNAIEDQIKGIEDRLKVEIDAINASSRTQEEKAQAVQVAEAKAAAEKAQLERRQAELDQRRAKFDKAVTIGKIITETALAVVHQLHTGDPITQIPRAIAVGAIGAAQLAVAVATPIPKFKGGRDFGPETYAIVGDGGKSEVITSPDMSQAYVTPATDTLTHLKKDWKVFPDIKEFMKSAGMMAAPQLSIMPLHDGDSSAMKLVGAVISEMNSLKQVVKDKKETHFYYKNGEMRKAEKKANDWTIYIQNNFK